jgi:signal transduction histidine kinase
MRAGPLTILHLEDSENDALLIEHLLREEFRNIVIVQTDNEAEYLKKIHDPAVRLVLSDFSLPNYDGIAALSVARTQRPELPFIFVSGAMGEDMAVECMKIGATDYVLKSNLKRLPSAIRRALTELDTRLNLIEAARVARVVPWHWNESEDTWLFGYLVKDILGHPPEVLRSTPGFLKSIVHSEDLPRFMSSLFLAKDRERMDFDCRLLHGNGQWIWTRWTLAWHDGRCRGILQDITELRTTQEALIQSQRLETVGMMIGGITHDFGNLIGAMNGAVELLSMSSLSESQQRHLSMLSRSCARALEFKEELMRLARKESAPPHIRTDLNAVVQEALLLLSHTLPRSIEVHFDACEELPLVQAIPAQLLQVLMNLAINARDAMGSKGILRFRCGHACLSEEEALENQRPGGRYVFVEVEDTGPGIPPELLTHVCDAFFTTKGEDKGTGLGLAMVRAIVQQHDGVLQIHSDPGKGARFRVLLPVADSNPNLDHEGSTLVAFRDIRSREGES